MLASDFLLQVGLLREVEPTVMYSSSALAAHRAILKRRRGQVLGCCGVSPLAWARVAVDLEYDSEGSRW